MGTKTSGKNVVRKDKNKSKAALPVKSEPKVLKPWDPRPKPIRGNKTKYAVYAGVGEALSCWTELEVALTNLFVTFSVGRGGHSLVAIRAFGSVRTMEGRLEMLRAAGEAFFLIEQKRCLDTGHNEDTSETLRGLDNTFSEVARYIKEFMSRRNEFAHAVVSPLACEGTKRPTTNPTFVLQPAPMDKKSRLDAVPTFGYDSAALNHYATEFGKLAKRVLQLNTDLHACSLQILQESLS